MKSLKYIALSLCFIFVVLGVCGCMSNDKNYNSAVLEYLNSKYDAEFKIVKSDMEFNGNDGDYFHAICTSTDYNDEFSVYCYPERESIRDKVIINDIEHTVYDNYAEIVFSKELEKQISEQIYKDIFLKCRITFPNYYVTDEEFKSGFKACLKDASILSTVEIFVVSSDSSIIEECQTKVEEICLQNNARWQYMYFATTSSEDYDEISKHYQKEYSSFDRHLKECELIERIQFALAKQDEGIIERSIEKE